MVVARRKPKRKRSRSRPTARRAPVRRSAQELDLDQLVLDVALRAEEAYAPETAVERVAELLVEDFEGMPSPLGFVRRLLEAGSPQRVHDVAEHVHVLAPGSITALTFDAERALVVDGDPLRASHVLDEALRIDRDPDGTSGLAEHLMAAGRMRDAWQLAEQAALDDPADEAAQDVLAAALSDIHRRSLDGEELDAQERAALARFTDRGVLDQVRTGVIQFVAGEPDLEERMAEVVGDWLEAAGADDEEATALLDREEELHARLEGRAGILRLAMEHAWLLGGLDDELDDDDPELEYEETALGRLAAEPDTPDDVAVAARRWLTSQTYGLWQVADPTPSPGLWLTDLASGVRRYAAIPHEQLEGVGRWAVLLGSLVAADGIWRTTGAFLVLRPSEGDSAAHHARETTYELSQILAGERPRRRRPRSPEPHGVLVEERGPEPPSIADLMGKVVGNLIPEIAGDVGDRRAAGPELVNTDGHPLRFITATLAIDDAAAAAAGLAAHADFRAEEDGELTWWGRELTALEQETAIASLRAETGQDIEPDEEASRWLRARLLPRSGGFEVELNSEERLAMLLAVLQELGAEATVTRRSVIDPSQDLPRVTIGGPLPFPASAEAAEAWVEHWPDERLPALGGLTPRAAARRQGRRARLEALLRELEHDADLLARAGRTAPPVERLRADLGMDRRLE